MNVAGSTKDTEIYKSFKEHTSSKIFSASNSGVKLPARTQQFAFWIMHAMH